MENKFTWGNSVLIKKQAPLCFHPGEFASICAIDKIITEQEAEELHSTVGEWIYLVEFENGSAIEIPEHFLEAYPFVLQFSWGDSVIIKKEAPSSFYPGKIARVFGFQKITTKELAEQFSLNIDDWIYVVKFQDKTEMLIPERYLERYKQKS